MKTTNTQRFHALIRDFRKLMEEINSKFDPAYEALEYYRDSQNYQAEKEKIDAARKEWTDEARQKATKELDSIIADMRATYEQKPSKAPTQEQVAVLTALRMRDTVSKRELIPFLHSGNQ